MISEWKQIWKGITDFFVELQKVLEAAGRLVLTAIKIVRQVGAFLSRHSGWWLAIPLAAGLSSPATHGWGVGYIADSSVLAWSPVALVPLLSIMIWAAFKSVDSDGTRRARPSQPEPEAARELAADEKRRQMADEVACSGKAGADSAFSEGLEIEEDPIVQEIIRTRYIGFVRGHSDDFVIGLLELTADGLELRDKRGFIDPRVKEAIEVPWEGIEFFNPRVALGDMLGALGYSCKAISFKLAGRHYVLLGLSGTEINDLPLVELSRTATDVVARYVFGDEIPEWMVAEA